MSLSFACVRISPTRLLRPVLPLLAFNVAAVLPACGAGDQILWYGKPAEKWTEALPVGNGHMGAMVFGGLERERIQFNEDTLWRGKPHDYARPNAVRHLPELRRLVSEGRSEEAVALGRAEFLGDPRRQMPFQPFGDLTLEFPGHGDAQGYRRELDLATGLARVDYSVGDVRHTREVFASYPRRALIVRLSADRAAQVNVRVGMVTPHADGNSRIRTSDTLELTGRVQPDGLRFHALARCFVEGGSVFAEDAALTVKDADSVALVLVAATSFRDFEHIDADPEARCEALLRPLESGGVAGLRAEHIADHQRLFSRVRLDLGYGARDVMPTDERLKSVKVDGLAADPGLAALHFQYGRYLLIASSRPGSQPANLQGVWNELLDPPWESKFTTNINFEMNYWPAEQTNLAECHEPMFDLIDDLVASGRRSARAYYGARGWVLHHNTDLWRGTAPVNNIDGIWPTGGAWLCWHLWERYRFSGDVDFLRNRAYPVMRAACEFFMDFLVPHAETGWLVTSPSYSPEQGTLTRGPAMDMQLIRALFKATREAAGVLECDAEFGAGLDAARERLVPDQVGRHGQLQEWLEDVDVPNNAHRHMSPLWALYPGDDINPTRPRVYEAARKLLSWRGDGSTGWSYAWRIPLWARVGDGEVAFRQLEGLLQRRTLPNLFDLCGPFQIDGNFGAAAGVAEMLVQSHLRAASDDLLAPEIVLLPALPHAWPNGSAHGLRARGGFEIDLKWSDGVLASVELRSLLGRPCRLRYREQVTDLHPQKGGSVTLDAHLRAAGAPGVSGDSDRAL